MKLAVCVQRKYYILKRKVGEENSRKLKGEVDTSSFANDASVFLSEQKNNSDLKFDLRTHWVLSITV